MALQCKVKGCKRKYFSSGYCAAHGQQMRRKGKTGPIREFHVGCKIKGCEGEHVAHGYCLKHYRQMRNKGKIYISRMEKNTFIKHDDFVVLHLRDTEGNIIGKTFIDLEDFERVRKLKWGLSGGKGYSYAVNEKTRCPLHRFLMKTKKMVDHIDRNTLNNRKANLRICDKSTNAQNGKMHKDNKSKYKGVCFSKGMKKYVAQIKRKDSSNEVIGYFSSAKEAAKAYDKAAIAHFGKFARTNHMEGRI